VQAWRRAVTRVEVVARTISAADGDRKSRCVSGTLTSAAVGGVAYDASTGIICLTEARPTASMPATAANLDDEDTWTIAILANDDGFAATVTSYPSTMPRPR